MQRFCVSALLSLSLCTNGLTAQHMPRRSTADWSEALRANLGHRDIVTRSSRFTPPSTLKFLSTIPCRPGQSQRGTSKKNYHSSWNLIISVTHRLCPFLCVSIYKDQSMLPPTIWGNGVTLDQRVVDSRLFKRQKKRDQNQRLIGS